MAADRRCVLGALAGGAASALLPASLRAQAWPSRPLRLVVPLGPGSSLDLSARLIAPPLAEQLGQPVVVENRPGAAANLGTQHVARATPNGHTFLYSGTGLAINPHLYRAAGFDPLADFAPVSLISENHLVLVARQGLPVTTVEELVALARARPGTLSCGSSGGLVQLGWLLFESLARVDVSIVPYKSVAQAVADVAAGHLDLAFSVGSIATGHADSGRVRLLAITDSKRRPGPLAALPPMAESVPGCVLKGWEGVLAPAGTEPEIVARLNRELVAAVATPDLRRRFVDMGYDVVAGSPAEFRRTIERDLVRFGKLVRDAGIQPE